MTCNSSGRARQVRRPYHADQLTSRSSARIGLRVCELLLAWVVVVGLSWADLLDLQHLVGGPSADYQQAIEPDLDEIRDDVTVIRVVGAALSESLAGHPSLVLHSPLASQATTRPMQGLLLQTLRLPNGAGYYPADRDVMLDQVLDGLAKSNTDVGGNYLTMRAQILTFAAWG